MIKTKTWIAIFTALALLSVVMIVLLRGQSGEACLARIYQNGACVEEIDLSRVMQPYTLAFLDDSGGTNTVRVEPGRICVSAADCPDQICVRQGWLTDGAGSIVCLPHGLVIQIEGASDVDAVTQ